MSTVFNEPHLRTQPWFGCASTPSSSVDIIIYCGYSPHGCRLAVGWAQSHAAVENPGFQWRSFCWWIFLDLGFEAQCGFVLFTTKGVKKFATWLRTLPNHISGDGVNPEKNSHHSAQNGSFFLLLSPYTTVYQRLPTVTMVRIWFQTVHTVA